MIIVNLLLGIMGIVAFLWLVIGLPAGGVWLLVNLTSKKKKSLNTKKWIIVTFGGMAMLLVVFILYMLSFLVIGMIASRNELQIVPEGKVVSPTINCGYDELCK